MEKSENAGGVKYRAAGVRHQTCTPQTAFRALTNSWLQTYVSSSLPQFQQYLASAGWGLAWQ